MPSTVIEHFHYDPESQELKIYFLSGAVYVYYQVPQEVFDTFRKYKSKGTFLNKHIKDNFEFKRIN